MSTPLLNPEFFDDPRLSHARRCWMAHGSKKVNGPHQKTKTRDTVIYVNASRETVARRIARKELSLRNFKLDHVHEISWNEYARSLPREYVSHVQTAAAGHRPAGPDEPDDEESETVDSPAGNKTWSDYANVTVKGAIQRLWRQIRGVFKDRLRDRSYTDRKTDLIKPEFQLEMLQIAKLTGFDYPAAMARAITAVKVPGSLQNLDPVTWKPKTAAKG